MTALSNITTSSLREQAARAIRAGIVAGDIKPGEIYSVPALAPKLGVSATPVREAMLDLVGEGLVVPVRNRGYRVVSLSAKELDDVLKLRLMLEVPSMGEVATLGLTDDLPRFRRLAERLPVLARRGEYHAYLDVDQEFHLGLLALLDNPRLVDIVSMLRNQTRLFDVGKLVVTGELTEAGAEHVEIVAAIESGDRKLTEKHVAHHLRRLRKTWSDDSVDADQSA